MSYQERRSIVSIISTILICVIYFTNAVQRYPQAGDYSSDMFHYWGTTILLLIVVSIAAKIVIYIVFSILNTIATRESEPKFLDERDKLIELKSSRNSLYVFMVGFLLAMIPLVLNRPPTVMFIVLIAAGILSEMIGDLSQFYFYRRGF